MASRLFVERFTDANYDEERYLATQPDVRAALTAGRIKTGREHFDYFGRTENRTFFDTETMVAARAVKMERIKPHLRTDMPAEWRDGRIDYLTPELRAATRISDTDAISSNEYDPMIIDLVGAHPDGLLLDCGAGSRSVYFDNVVNYEIVDYPSTDVLGVGEELPFRDGSFDAVISVAVLEHVRDPFRCASEIIRVMKPGGRLFCAVPFLQPYHGYPHHYFNMSHQGLRSLFEDALTIDTMSVPDSMHPIFTAYWILSSWAAGLPPAERRKFEALKVADLIKPPGSQVGLPYCRALTDEKRFELASATLLTAHKPLG